MGTIDNLGDRELLSVSECEKLTGRKAATWRKDILLRKIAYVKLGRQVKIPVKAVRKFIESGYVPAVPGGQAAGDDAD